MAAKKKPSMLARQRQLIKQRNQTKAQASRQLPAKGESSANSIKARGQRAATRVQQKVNQDVATVRALADNMKRNQAREARQIKPDPSPKTRYVGPEGANPRGQAALPPGQRGGEMRQRGGAIIRSSSGELSTGNQKSVKVRDLGARQPQQLNGTSNQRSLPAAGQSGGSKPPKGTSVPQRGGPARTVAQVAQERRSAAASKAAGQNIRSASSSSSKVSTGTPVGEATRAATRGSNIARSARNVLGKVIGPAAAGAAAASTFGDARRRGETPGRAGGQALAAAAGFAGGAKAGALVPGPPIVKGAAALAGGALGSAAALRGAQGVQEAGKSADRRKSSQTFASTRPERQGPTVPQRMLAQGAGRSNAPTAQKAPSAPKLPTAEGASSTPTSTGRRSASPSKATVRKSPSSKPSTAKQSAEKVSESSQVSGIGPVKDGQTYASKRLSIQETLRELREMRKRSQERQKQGK